MDGTPTRRDVYINELGGVLTKQQVAQIFEVSLAVVKRDIDEGRLFAAKRSEAKHNSRTGIWLIPFSAAKDLYQNGTEQTYVIR